MSQAMRAGGLAALCSILAGCTVGPDFLRPSPPDLSAYRNTSATDPAVSLSTNPDPRWWQKFNDPVLTQLVNTAIRQNLDVQQAVLRVIESRQSIVTARSAGLPMLNGTGSYMREQLGAKGILQSQDVYRQLNSLADQAQGFAPLASAGLSSGSANQLLNRVTQPVDLFSYGLSASWELDLFGRVRRSVEQARAQAEAQEEAANDSLTSMQSDVAQAYVQLRGAQAMQASQEENVRTAQESFGLTARRQRSGLSTGVDVEQARTQLLNSQRQLPQYDKQRQQAINRLNVLIGSMPGTLDAQLQAPAPFPSLPDVVGVGVPSTLARRRPDIRQAEAQLHAATAGVGVAVAQFYPDISLTGSLGIRALDVGYLTRWASHYYSVGPSLSLPIFQGGQLTANLRLNRAQAIEAALKYRAAVLNGLREVEDALVSYRYDRIERDRQRQVVKSAEDTQRLSRSRFSSGLGDFLQVLDSQRTLESARQQLVQEEMTLANDIVTLYRALGGGWEDPGAQSEPPQLPDLPPIAPAALDSVAAGVK